MTSHTATVPDVRRVAIPERHWLPIGRRVVGGFLLVMVMVPMAIRDVRGGCRP
jgi:hypothetical protein